MLLIAIEPINPRHKSWQLMEGTVHRPVLCRTRLYGPAHGRRYIGDGVIIEAIQGAYDWDKLNWFTGLPLLVQALMISLIFDFGQYWMHRGMHNWYPLWLTHAPHHYITQLNINKGAVGNPIELFLIGLGIGGFFDFLPRAALLAGTFGLAIGTYQHINVRFNTPRWWRFLFNTTEHHSVHHSQDYEASRSNSARPGSFRSDLRHLHRWRSGKARRWPPDADQGNDGLPH